MSSEIQTDQLEILKVFFKKNPTKKHWIQLPHEILAVLTGLINSSQDNEIASLLKLKGSTIGQFRSEKKEVDEISKAIEEENENPEKGKSVSYVHIRYRVTGLLSLVPLGALSRLLGIPRSTLFGWRRDEKKKKDRVTHKVDKAVAIPDVSVTKPIKAPPVVDIQQSQELKELYEMIERHKGKTRKKYSKSEKDLILKLVDRFGSKLVHLHTKVSYDTLARLLRQREQGHIVPSTKGKYLPVLETMKKYPGMGPMQIRDYVHRHMGLSMGVNSVRKAMEDNGWIASYTRKIFIEEESRSYEAVRKNYLWHLDFKHFYINKCKIYLLFIEDDFSRFIVGHTLSDAEKVEVVIECLNRCIHRHGKPEMIMSDGGSAFYSWRGISNLTRFLEDFGIDQKIARIPQVNGKVESINQKIEKELLNVQSFSSLNHLQEELSEWVGFYNFKRPHQGLNKLQVPADRYYPGADKWFKDNDKGTDNLIVESMATLLKELKKK